MIYSIVLPIYNEAGNIPELHRRLTKVMTNIGKPFELIYVNDGSSDESGQLLAELQDAVVVSFRKNFGQTAAMDAGIKQATGEFIITLDSDLQNPPEEIPKLITAQQEQRVDVVSGWRKHRQDKASKHFVSRGANMLRKIFLEDNIHDSGCSLKLYRRECFDDLDLHGEMHRFIPGLLQWRGFTIGEVVVEHAARTAGVTKYGYSRIIKGLVDMVSVWFWRKYSSRPLHLFGGSGLVLAGSGSVGLICLAVARLFFDFSLSTSIWPTITILFILVGVQLFISGLLAEILIKSYYQGGRTTYTIKQVTRR